jgi:hypothetical protein
MDNTNGSAFSNTSTRCIVLHFHSLFFFIFSGRACVRACEFFLSFLCGALKELTIAVLLNRSVRRFFHFIGSFIRRPGMDGLTDFNEL